MSAPPDAKSEHHVVKGPAPQVEGWGGHLSPAGPSCPRRCEDVQEEVLPKTRVLSRGR